MTGIQIIEAERQRQISKEGYTPEHDDQHRCGEMADAAAVYAATQAIYVYGNRTVDNVCFVMERHTFEPLWPWGADELKLNCSRIHQLAKAGALIAAEIERLKRIKEYSIPKSELSKEVRLAALHEVAVFIESHYSFKERHHIDRAHRILANNETIE